MAPDSRRPPTGATSSPLVRAMRKEKESEVIKELVEGQKQIAARLAELAAGLQQLVDGQQQLAAGLQQLAAEIKGLKSVIITKENPADEDVAIETEDDADSGCEENVMHSWS